MVEALRAAAETVRANFEAETQMWKTLEAQPQLAYLVPRYRTSQTIHQGELADMTSSQPPAAKRAKRTE